MFDLVRGFSEVIDLVNTTLASHHQRVAYIVDRLAQRLSLDRTSWNQAVLSAMLHDVGVIPLQDQTDELVFEKDMERHSVAGWLLLDSCPIFKKEAQIIRYHHTSWHRILNLPEDMRAKAELGNLIHLADMADVHVRTNSSPDELTEVLRRGADKVYSADSVEAALDLFSTPGFFNTLTEAAAELALPPSPELELTADNGTLFSLLFSHVIDARSPFTATHSTGVAHMVRYLHECLDLPPEDRRAIFVAGLLHDIGKMGVPLNLLEKKGPLEAHEFQEVSRHARLSKEVLSAIPGFERVAPWGAMHHEKLNGRGYPDGLRGEEIPLESRLTAVADVLTALTEDRPYRPGLGKSDCLKILDQMVANNELDKDVVAAVHDNYDEIRGVCRQAQTLASRFFRDLAKEIHSAADQAA